MKTEPRFADYAHIDEKTNHPVQVIQYLIYQVANDLHIPVRFRKAPFKTWIKEAYITELNRHLTDAKQRVKLN